MSKPIARRKIEPGAVVLMGMAGVSMPGEWHIGEVVWISGDHVLVMQQHIGGAGAPYPYLHEISYIRAVGTVSELVGIQTRCREELKPLTDAVKAAEEALRAARDAVYARLDEIAAAEPMRDAGGGI